MRWPRVLAGAVAATMLVVGLVLGLAFVRAPSSVDLQRRAAQFARAHGAEPTSLEQVSPLLREAVVAIEDERFYRHRGVDPIALLRAVPYDLTHLSLAQGASTITEQLAKTLYLSGSDRSPWRKLLDVALGFRIGHRYSRETILADYLGVAYFGEGRYGARAAARFYFGRSARSLDLARASLLAGLVQGPSLLDPLRDPAAARARQVAVLRALVRNGYATEAEASAAIARPLRLRGGIALPALRGVEFEPPAPFDWVELAGALSLSLAAFALLAGTRFARPGPARRQPVRVAAFVLIGVAALTLAHSVQTL